MFVDKSIIATKGVARTDRHYLSGTVTVDGVPASRMVVVFDRSSFTLLGITISDASGNWKIWGVSQVAEGDILVVALMDDPTVNAMCADHISQVVAP